MIVTSSIIFSEVKNYLKLGRELQAYLAKYPDDWKKFQNIFNLTLDKVYKDILEFEKENMDNESKVYKMKKIFEKRYRRHFLLYGEYITWCLEKPYGYSGDFKIIDNIYCNQPRTNSISRLWDNWFLQLAAPKAVRERKRDFKKIIFDFVKERGNKNLRIMNLASGSAREIKELLEADSNKIFIKTIFDCYDFDARAIDYAKTLLNNYENVNFFQKNAIRMALKKDIETEVTYKYNLIYSTGLFDYLDGSIATRLVGNLKKLLKNDGVMVISNAADKYNNSSVGWMEWVVEWYLIYRTKDEFKKIFLDGGISPKELQIMPQESKVMQYALVNKE